MKLRLLLLIAIATPSLLFAEAQTTVVIENVTYPLLAIGKDVKVTKFVNPVYPASAVAEGRGGKVPLRLVVSEKGRVVNVLVGATSADEDIKQACVNAARGWRFGPYKPEGVAKAFVADIPMSLSPKK